MRLSVCPISLLSTILGCQGKFVLVLNLHSLVTVFGANVLQFILFTELPPLLRPTCHSQSWHLSRICRWKVRKVRFWGNRGAADIRKINPTKFQATEFGDTRYVKYWIQKRLLPLYFLTQSKMSNNSQMNICQLLPQSTCSFEKIQITRVKSKD